MEGSGVLDMFRYFKDACFEEQMLLIWYSNTPRAEVYFEWKRRMMTNLEPPRCWGYHLGLLVLYQSLCVSVYILPFTIIWCKQAVKLEITSFLTIPDSNECPLLIGWPFLQQWWTCQDFEMDEAEEECQPCRPVHSVPRRWNHWKHLRIVFL